MLSIVAHHYVVNSGLLSADGVNSNPNVALWAIWTAGRAKI